MALLLVGFAPTRGWAQPAPDARPSAEARLGMQRLEAHIADLKRRMGITPAQQPQWHAFTSVMRENAQGQEALHAGAAAATSATDTLRAYTAKVRGHAAGLERLMPPFDALYAVMSPTQRAAADRVFQQFEAEMEHRRSGLSG